MLPTFSYARSIGSLHGAGAVALLVVLTLIPASELALCFLNHTITLLVKPRPLPSMNTESGIPADAQTMVVIPMLLTKSTHTPRTHQAATICTSGDNPARLLTAASTGGCLFSVSVTSR